MKYMLMRKADADTEQGVLPSETVLQAMADYNERMTQAGVFVSGNGLRPSKEGCRITFRDGEPQVTPGPFEAPEDLLAGYSVLEVDSLEEAIEWAKQWPKEDADPTLELRRYFTLEDFAPGNAIDKHRLQGRVPAALNLHLHFAGNCREAMSWYAELTGGQIEAMIPFRDTPMQKDVPDDWQNKILHASLNIRGHRLMGGDMAGDCYRAPQGSAVHLDYTEAEDAERVFRALAEGGEVAMPFEETFWAQRFGMVKDRFGIHWMISLQLGDCVS